MHCCCGVDTTPRDQGLRAPWPPAAHHWHAACGLTLTVLLLRRDPSRPERVFVMDDAVEPAPAVIVPTGAAADDPDAAAAAAAPAPAPPCVVLLDDGAGVHVDVVDRGDSTGIIAVRPQEVRVQAMASVANEKCNAELLEFLAKALALRRSTLSVRSLCCVVALLHCFAVVLARFPAKVLALQRLTLPLRALCHLLEALPSCPTFVALFWLL